MIEVPLSKGLAAMIDDADEELVCQYRWHVQINPTVSYARRIFRAPDGRHCAQLMHSLITGFAETDHIDGDGLNNCRSNLRAMTRPQNGANARKRRGTSSQYKGVFWRERHGKWNAQIYLPVHRKLDLGLHKTEVAAALAYDSAARRHFGEFAALNFPEPGERSCLATAQPS